MRFENWFLLLVAGYKMNMKKKIKRQKLWLVFKCIGNCSDLWNWDEHEHEHTHTHIFSIDITIYTENSIKIKGSNATNRTRSKKSWITLSVWEQTREKENENNKYLLFCGKIQTPTMCERHSRKPRYSNSHAIQSSFCNCVLMTRTQFFRSLI